MKRIMLGLLFLVTISIFVAIRALDPVHPDSDEVLPVQITGRVRLRGEAPPPRPLPLDGPCAEQYDNTLPKTRFLLTGADHGLCDAVVYISAGLPLTDSKPAQPPLELKETRCLIEPCVSAVQARQPVTVRNQDDMLHNVFIDCRRNRAFNYASLPKSSPIEFALPSEEFFVPLKCDVHPWETAYLSVIEHPFFAVTDKDGNFRISGVPPGTYTMTARHRLAGSTSAEIKVLAKGSNTVEFTLDSPNQRSGQNATPTRAPRR